MILKVRRGIADITERERYEDPVIIDEIKRAISEMPNISGMVSSHRLTYSFRPIEQTAVMVNREIFENIDNMKTNYYLTLVDDTAEGSIESKAHPIPDMQVALVTVHWHESGSTGPPVIDISLDKDPGSGETMQGSWLAGDSRIAAIENGVEIDVSDIPSPSFSLKWTLPANSDYRVLDTSVFLLLVNSSKMLENKTDIALMAEGNIFADEAARFAKEGSEEYAAFLNTQAEMRYAKVRGRVGGSSGTSLGIQTVEHTYDRSTRASRAFNAKFRDGTWVEITGNEVTGRRIRWAGP
jgi:hypothetical protein